VLLLVVVVAFLSPTAITNMNRTVKKTGAHSYNLDGRMTLAQVRDFPRSLGTRKGLGLLHRVMGTVVYFIDNV
jgi:hypothetical protein